MENQPEREIKRDPSHQLTHPSNSRRTASRNESLTVPGVVMLSLIGLAAAIAIQFPDIFDLPFQSAPTPVSTPKPESFRQAVNKAMSAAELTQAAQFQEEWIAVATLWREAIELMQKVPDSSAEYALAQQKVGEYERNLNYAQTNVETRPAKDPATSQFWTVGSIRERLITVQGTPTRVIRLDTQCKEIFSYNNSQVELEYGVVNRYDNFDGNLKVVGGADPSADLSVSGTWTLGSSKEDLLRIQGTPTRVSTFSSIDRESLYYDNNFIELKDGFVIAYSNFDGKLKVDTSPLTASASTSAGEFWSIGASRADVFRVQNTPTQVIRNDSMCQEVLYYQDSTIELRNGIVSGYDNLSKNLRVK